METTNKSTLNNTLTPEHKTVVTRLVSELMSLSREDKASAVRASLNAVRTAQEQRNKAKKEWLVALRILRKVAGGPTFTSDGTRYQIRVREGKPFICILDEGNRAAAA